MLHNHHRLLTRKHRRGLPGLLAGPVSGNNPGWRDRDANGYTQVPADRWQGAVDRGLLLPKEVDDDAGMTRRNDGLR